MEVSLSPCDIVQVPPTYHDDNDHAVLNSNGFNVSDEDIYYHTKYQWARVPVCSLVEYVRDISKRCNKYKPACMNNDRL